MPSVPRPPQQQSPAPPQPPAPQQPQTAKAEPVPAPAASPIRTATQPKPRPGSQPKPEGLRPPPGMSDADVSALYTKYVKAKEAVGETIGPNEQAKLLKTINAQAPKIMQQYNAKGVEFSVVVKDDQVIIRAKPKG
jgi:hypothetical protein